MEGEQYPWEDVQGFMDAAQSLHGGDAAEGARLFREVFQRLRSAGRDAEEIQELWRRTQGLVVGIESPDALGGE